MSNCSIRPIDRTLSGATTLDQSGLGSDDNEEVLRIPQSSSLTEASPSDCLVSYPRHLLGESYSSAEIQSVYSAAPTDWAKVVWKTNCCLGLLFPWYQDSSWDGKSAIQLSIVLVLQQELPEWSWTQHLTVLRIPPFKMFKCSLRIKHLLIQFAIW